MSGLEWFGLISGIIGLAGTVFGVWTYYRSKQRSEITWSVRHTQIIEGSKTDIPELCILFGDHEIPYLKSTVLTIKNTGTSDLDRADLRRKAVRFSLGIDREQLLNVRLLQEDQDKEENTFAVAEEDGEVVFSFENMGKKELARIQVLHTAEENPKVESATGRVIKNGGLISEKEKRKKLAKWAWFITALGVMTAAPTIIICYPIITTIRAATEAATAIFNEDTLRFVGGLGGSVLSLILLGFGLVLLFKTEVNHP